MPRDNLIVDCKTCREALSARLDGEPEPVPAAWTDQHFRDCGACQSWHAQATIVTRALRVRSATPTPDLAEAVLAAAPSPIPRRWWPRVALAGVALAQLALGTAQVFGADVGVAHGEHSAEGMTAHLLNESTAWNLALGMGMFWVALRTRAASGMLPVLSGFLAVLTAFSVHDLIAGHVALSRVVSHGLLVLGLGLLYAVHRQRNHRDPAPGRPEALTEPTETTYVTREFAGQHEDGRQPRRPPLRPASHHRAA